MGIDILGIDIMGVDILGIDILAPTRLREGRGQMSSLCFIRGGKCPPYYIC